MAGDGKRTRRWKTLTQSRDRWRERALMAEEQKREVVKQAKSAARLKYEEGYNEALLAFAPKLLELDEKVTSTALRLIRQLESGQSVTKGEAVLLRTLLAESGKQRDRLYGKTRQRVDTTTLSASVDINELLSLRDSPLLARADDPATLPPSDVEAEVVDVLAEEEE